MNHTMSRQNGWPVSQPRDSASRCPSTLRKTVFGIVFLLGCNPSTGPQIPAGPLATVTGTVEYDGHPITEGMLNLDSGKGFMLSGRISTDGKFELASPWGKKLPAGTYTVAVLPLPPDPGAAPTPEKMFEARQKTKGKDAKLPQKYTRNATSGVTVQINEGPQEIEIKLVK